MNIFKTIGDALKKITTSKDKIEGINKQDILDLIDNNIVLLQTVIDTFDNHSDIFKYIQKNLLPASGSNKENHDNFSMYHDYFKQLSPIARRAETTLIFKSIRDAVGYILTDHNKIRDTFDSLFNQGTDVSEITIEQLKLSHATIFGFINLSALLCDWFCFIYTSLVGNPEDKLRVPAYRIQVIMTSTDSVAKFVSDVVNRGAHKDILDVLAEIKSKGDVTLYTENASLDTYANINDYPGALNFMGSFAKILIGGIGVGLLLKKVNPILFVREFFTQRAHEQYKRNIATRDWMATKTAILQMDMANVDPSSPEYQKLVNVLSKYSDIIAEFDKKISEYENS